MEFRERTARVPLAVTLCAVKLAGSEKGSEAEKGFPSQVSRNDGKEEQFGGNVEQVLQCTMM